MYSNNMSTYIKPTSDIFTHYLLGSEHNRHLLLSFINAVMEDSGFFTVEDVEIMNPFNATLFEMDKSIVLDVKARDHRGKIYNIEIQSTGNAGFIHRSLYYWAKTYSGQLERSEKYTLLHPVVCINLMDFVLIPGSPKVHTIFYPVEKHNANLRLTDHFEIHYIELPKVGFKWEQGGGIFTQSLLDWLKLFIAEGREEEDMKTVLESVMERNETIRSAHEEYLKFSSDDRYRELYEARLKWQRDQMSLMDSEHERGWEEGIQEGRQEGKTDVARRMLAKGYPLEDIAEITGLSEEEIQKL